MELSEKIAWLSILTNTVLLIIKVAIALFSGSLAVKADALHSLTDVISSAVILVGIKISKRPSRRFPYGLYKVENLVAMGTSLLIFLAGYEIVKEVFSTQPRPLPTHIPLAIAGICVTILIAYSFSRYELKNGMETGSPSLVADAQHILTDVLSSFVILTALAGGAIGLALDRYAAIVVIVFIGRSAATIFLGSMRVLLDASLDFESLTKIRNIVLSDVRVKQINELWARNAGRYKFIELDLTLRVKDLEKGHRIAEEIENRVKMEITQVDRVLIHYQPQQRDQLTLAVPVMEDRQTISEHFGEAPLFFLLMFRPHDGTTTAEHILSNPFIREEKRKGIKVANWLLNQGVDILITNKDQTGKGSGLALGNAGVEILLTREMDARKAVEIVREELTKDKPKQL